jgi:hypothetical protein
VSSGKYFATFRNFVVLYIRRLSMKMEALNSIVTSVTWPKTQHHVPVVLNLQQYRCKNLKCYKKLLI